MKGPRGDVLLFTLVLVIPFLLTMAGLAVDIAGLVTVRSELHRAMDAAALAGAGNLGFDASVFPTVRQTAATYAANNPFRFGQISLNVNTANDPAGDIVLGVWDDATRNFAAAADGTRVNAVLCRTTQNFPTAFLGIIGLATLPISAQSIAVANPPNRLPPSACPFPMGVTSCQFQRAGAFTSQGCGTAVTFATSSGKVPGTQAGTNTAAWVDPTNPNAPNLKAAIAAANTGTGCNSDVVVGQNVEANNGMIQNVVDDLFDSNKNTGYFLGHYTTSEVYTIEDVNKNVVYTGKGWEVYVSVIQTDCPPKAITGPVTIQTFSRFLITQIINNGFCAVSNSGDLNSWPLCPPPMNPAGLPRDPDLRAIFGYFACGGIDTVPTPVPTPRAALATRLRLVQ